MDSIHTDCLVVGAGPVGMVTALELARRGRAVAIVDKYRRTALQSYALALHPETVRLLAEMGVAERLLEIGQQVRWITVHDGSTPVADIDVSRVGGDFPFVLVVPQTVLEGALEAGLGEAAVSVRWGHQLLGFDSGADKVHAVVAAVEAGVGDQEATVVPARVAASYVVGADGGGSLTARLVGVEHEAVGPPLEYALVEFEGRLEASDRAHLVLGPGTTDVFWPIGPERARWSIQLAEGPEGGAADDPRELIRARAPWFGAIERIEWTTTVRFQPFLANRFGRKRVWLAGDASHATSPIGVQSMNVGMREGRDLARRIAAVLDRRASSLVLRVYQEDRQREWKMLLGIKNRVRCGSGAPRWAAENAGRLVVSLPASGQDLNVLLRQLGFRLDWMRRRRPASASGPGSRRSSRERQHAPRRRARGGTLPA